MKADLEALKAAHVEQDVAKIDETSQKLNESWNAISTRLYQESSQAQNDSNTEAGGNGEVEDTDFEEVV